MSRCVEKGPPGVGVYITQTGSLLPRLCGGEGPGMRGPSCKQRSNRDPNIHAHQPLTPSPSPRSGARGARLKDKLRLADLCRMRDGSVNVWTPLPSVMCELSSCRSWIFCLLHRRHEIAFRDCPIRRRPLRNKVLEELYMKWWRGCGLTSNPYQPKSQISNHKYQIISKHQNTN